LIPLFHQLQNHHLKTKRKYWPFFATNKKKYLDSRPYAMILEFYHDLKNLEFDPQKVKIDDYISLGKKLICWIFILNKGILIKFEQFLLGQLDSVHKIIDKHTLALCKFCQCMHTLQER
jgi:hypothetical protein